MIRNPNLGISNISNLAINNATINTSQDSCDSHAVTLADSSSHIIHQRYGHSSPTTGRNIHEIECQPTEQPPSYSSSQRDANRLASSRRPQIHVIECSSGAIEPPPYSPEYRFYSYINSAQNQTPQRQSEVDEMRMEPSSKIRISTAIFLLIVISLIIVGVTALKKGWFD